MSLSHEVAFSLLEQWRWEHKLLLEVQKDLEDAKDNHALFTLINQRDILYRKIGAAEKALDLSAEEIKAGGVTV